MGESDRYQFASHHRAPFVILMGCFLGVRIDLTRANPQLFPVVISRTRIPQSANPSEGLLRRHIVGHCRPGLRYTINAPSLGAATFSEATAVFHALEELVRQCDWVQPSLRFNQVELEQWAEQL